MSKLSLFFIITLSIRLFSQEWQFLGLEGESISAIAVDCSNPNIIYTGSGSDYSSGRIGGIFKSVDGGAQWDTLIRGVTVRDLDIHPKNGQIIFATLGINVLTNNPGIIKSEDGGFTWVRADSGIRMSWEQGPIELVIDPHYPDTIYTGTGGPFGGPPYKSINGGESWFRIDPDSAWLWREHGIGDSIKVDPLEDGIVSIAIDPQNTEHLYFGTAGLGEIFETSDGGNSWNATGLAANELIYDIQIDPLFPEKIYAGLSRYGFFMSNDYGKTWLNINEGITDNSFNLLDIQLFTKNEITYIYVRANWGDSSGIYLLNENLIWEQIEISGRRISTIAIRDSKLYAGSSGLYVKDLPTTINNPIKHEPNSFAINIFPNPANSTIQVNLKFSKTAYTIIDIFDILGRRKETLYRGTLIPGTFRRNFDLSSYSSGVYIINVIMSREVKNKKVILLR